MLAWLLDPIAGGLSQVYGRPLGHDVAVVFLLVFAAVIVLAIRWKTIKPGILGRTAPLALVRPTGVRRLLDTASTLLRGAPGARATVLVLVAVVIVWAVNVVPLGIGVALTAQGEPVRGVIYAALGYLWIWLFLALLPI